ncbi:MAG TPA: VWA domain-containing protein [Thermoanaerobaculia bacterium]|nr:VWA domain-containing protein [Thermoanaerobaculia bacterium]
MKALALVLLLFAALVPVLAQEEPGTFEEKIEVSVVNLEVFVTDKKGVPILDLRREDFEVLEDGKPVEITNFYAEEGAQEGAEEGVPAVRSVDQRLSLVVFVDDVNLEPQNRNRILGRVRELLPGQLSPGDQVMVVRFHGGLEVLRPFTGDVQQVAADLAGMEKLSGDLRRREETRDMAAFQAIEAAGAMGGWGAVESIIKQYAATESALVRGALEGLDQVVGWIASLPGRKAILYVSDGIPAIPGEDLYLWASTRSGYRTGQRISMLDSQGFDATKRFREVTSRASRNRVAFYPIETMGAHMERGATLQENRISNRQNGLRILAEETGGLAMLNAADPGRALQRMAADLSTYYSIGYRPLRIADDREHKIEVNVRRKGATVRHRRWYKDKPIDEAVADRTSATMVFGVEENPLGATVEIGDQIPAGDGFVVPVRVKVPIGKLFLEPKGASREGRLRLFMVASGEGRLTPVRETRMITVTVPEAEMTAGQPRDYVHEVRIKLEKGSWTVGVGVRDEIAATTSYLQRKFEAGAASAGR